MGYFSNFNLIDMRRIDLRKTLQFLDMPNAPIANTNNLGPAIFKQLLQRLVDLFPTLSAHASSMNQEEVDISVLAVNFLDTVQHLLVSLVCVAGGAKDFGCDEHIGAFQARLSKGFSNFLLVGVVSFRKPLAYCPLPDLGIVLLRGVDVPVSCLQSCQGRVRTLGTMSLVYSKA